MRKGLEYEQIKEAIEKAPEGSTMYDLADMLGVTHVNIIYHFKKRPALKELYKELHKDESKIKNAIISTRNNATKAEIARSLSMSKQSFWQYLKFHPEIGSLYDSLHNNCEKKITKSTLEKITYAITKESAGTAISKINKKYGIRLCNYFKDFPELKNLYVSIHGKPKAERRI